MSGYRNILVITLGQAPALVTETIYALLNPQPEEDETRPERWVPHEIHIVTTVKGRADAKPVLCRRDGPLVQLFRNFDVEPVEPIFVVPKITASGVEVEDIRTRQENVAYANELTSLIERLARPREHRLHVSLAGGRKTMSSYAHAAISLFGRAQDELSHILVEPKELESSGDFFWPGQPLKEVTAQGKLFHSDDPGIRVHLVRSPFVPLGGYLRRRPFPKGDIDYQRMIDHAKASLAAPDLRLDTASRTVSIGDQTVELGPQEFAFFRVLATARQEAWPGYGAGGTGHNQGGWIAYRQLLDRGSLAHKRFFEFWHACYPGMPGAILETFEAALNALLDEMEHPQTTKSRRDAQRKTAQDMFKSVKKRVLDELRRGVGESPAARAILPEIIKYRDASGRGGWAVGIHIDPHNIVIGTSPDGDGD